ncbi:nucleotide-binding protein [Vibrio parahaemolyticus]|uniref:TIR domain-containing protein n=1 Tax=Vibrio parahaemolyticus TaxID=670 RepID=UPI0003FAB14E|nr:nucleotide-binding protein [Vibrio parahaemolyticus]EGR1568373.1 hypothetical protein [Vibrio parahaemolyticus]EIE7521335.1 nucleotide-binding protein [Vibrio parahaemolyticus]EJC7971365.1 nucleotide-binding protein [Vibrio parahaemolyticus]MDF4340941.1 nucleotide-binding protein [Vibrio parahaemolyticus]MDF4932002.1 nucleotide-binding protein [Vibrio parahaemolyticus]
MKKTKYYKSVRFGSEVIKKAHDYLLKIAEQSEVTLNGQLFTVVHDDSKWSYDSRDEFFSDYRKFRNGALFCVWGERLSLSLTFNGSESEVIVESNERAVIESTFYIFDSHEESYFDPKLTGIKPLTVFIGHGRSSDWRDLKDHLQDKHNIKIEAYETGARAGHTIRDILEDMANKSTFALLVMSAEDELPTGEFRARQNVIHEIGLFQGKLGFNKAIVLMEHGVEEFSNIYGVQQIRYSNISETFGEVLATINREFK